MRAYRVVSLLAVAAGACLQVAGAMPAAAGPHWDADKWAVLVGVDQYRGSVRDIHGSVGDVKDLHEIIQRSGWPADHVRILTNEQATAGNIRAAWKWLIANAGDNSFSIFHYSGHIKQLSGDRDRDGEALDEYLWPVDNGYLSDAELSHNMRQIRGWTWIDISGCEGGGLDDGASAVNRLFTAASQEREKAYDHRGWKNSVFTHFLADQAILQGKGNRDGDKRVSIQEAFDLAAREAPHYTRYQSKGPQHPYIAGGDGSQWFFHLIPLVDLPRPGDDASPS